MKYDDKKYQEALNLFGLKEGYTLEELKTIYRPLIAKWHPDVNPGKEAEIMSKRINEAKIILEKKLDEEKLLKDEKKIQKTYDLEREKFLKDITALKNTYIKYGEIVKICNKFSQEINEIYNNEDISLVNKLEELRRQKEDFNSKIKVLKDKINYQMEKNEFLKKLQVDRSKFKINDLIKLTIFYQEKLNNIYSQEGLDSLKKEYESDIVKIQKDEEKRIFLQDIQKRIEKTNTLKNKYENKEIKDLITKYQEKILVCKTYKELNDMENELYEKINIIIEKEKEFNKYKRTIIYKLKNYEKEYQEEKEIFISYIDKINNINNLETLKELEKEIDLKLVEIKTKYDKQIEEVNKKKDQYKRIMIYKFLFASKTYSLNDIYESISLLKKILVIINNMNYNTIDSIRLLVEKVNFKNLNTDKSNIEFYSLANDRLSNKEDVNNFLENIKVEEDDVSDYNDMSNERRNIINNIIESYYHVATANNIECDLNLSDLLFKVLSTIQKINEKDLIEKYEELKKISFKNLDQMNDILKQFSLERNVFINYLNGEVYNRYDINDDYLLIPINLDKGVEIVDKNKFKFNYISLEDFFKKAMYIDEQVVLEQKNNGDLKKVFKKPGESFLYVYSKLMLKCSIIEDKHIFSFVTTKYGYDVIEEDILIPDSRFFKYKDIDFCLKSVVSQIEEQIDKNNEKENEESFDF